MQKSAILSSIQSVNVVVGIAVVGFDLGLNGLLFSKYNNETNKHKAC